MNWSNPAQFLEMGGYGLHVWGAFGMTALAVAVEIGHVLVRRRQLARRGPGEGA
ncbi:heme exporter protein CcmD [Variovorax sp. J22R133]|uniref:heme exporter protein CcmD n=1 Tax=Variovorax brevis TaxID=3053503 RepID=UPI0025789FED|nr:heme exporter protein CcmD [Variovorax sp. J22R133]MDM0113781.1 heme exporter protein CcmD [Variovorax sp. J22R133]